MSYPAAVPARKTLPSPETYSVFEPASNWLSEATPAGAGKVNEPLPAAPIEYIAPGLVWAIGRFFKLAAIPEMTALPRSPLPSAEKLENVLRRLPKFPLGISMLAT